MPALAGKTIDGNADLRRHPCVGGWPVDAIKPAFAISLQRFEDKARCYTMTDAGFDDSDGPLVTDEAPDCPDKFGIAVVPAHITLGTELIPFGNNEFGNPRP